MSDEPSKASELWKHRDRVDNAGDAEGYRDLADAAIEAVGRLEREIRALRAAADKEPRCEGCGCAADLSFAPDPYEWERNDDDTPVWLCGQCRSERALDI